MTDLDVPGDLSMARRAKVISLCFAGLLAVSGACQAEEPSDVQKELANVVRGNTAFAVDAYGWLAKNTSEPNICFSPIGLGDALALLHSGAGGTTAEQLGKLLHLEGEKGRIAYPLLGRRLGMRCSPSTRARVPTGIRIKETSEKAVVIAEVVAASPAHLAGLVPGDQVEAIDNQKIASAAEYVRAMDRLQPVFLFQVTRAGQTLTAKIELVVQGRGYEFCQVLGLWGDRGVDFRASFVSRAETDYAAEVRELHMSSAPQGSRLVINGWMAEQSADRYLDFLAPRALPADAQLVLAGAAYCKAAWAAPFDRDDSEKLPFKITPQRIIKPPTMQQIGEFRLYKGKGFQALELPYQRRELSLVLLLPDAADKLDTLEKNLTPALLDDCFAGLEKAEKQAVDVKLPSFKLTGEANARDLLNDLGAGTAVRDKADFSGMVRKTETWLSLGRCKTAFAVNEAGSDVTAPGPAVPKPAKAQVSFQADRPFLFLVREPRTGALLLMGRIVNPQF